MFSERRASVVSAISRENQLAQEREARTLAEHQLELCRKELKAAESRLHSNQEMFKKELSDSEFKFSMQREKIETLLRKQEDSERQLDVYLQELRKLQGKSPSELEGKAGKTVINKLKKRLEEKDRYIDSLVQRMDSETVLEAAETAGLGKVGNDRQSLDILATLSEDDDVEEEEAFTPVADSEVDAAAIAHLQKGLTASQQECEELRQTADRCWVREQAATKRTQDLEKENQQLSDFTEDMKASNGRILEGLREMRVRTSIQLVREQDLDEALTLCCHSGEAGAERAAREA